MDIFFKVTMSVNVVFVLLLTISVLLEVAGEKPPKWFIRFSANVLLLCIFLNPAYLIAKLWF